MITWYVNIQACRQYFKIKLVAHSPSVLNSGTSLQVKASSGSLVCEWGSVVIEIASRREMKRKVIESIQMKIKLNAYAHTFIHIPANRAQKHTPAGILTHWRELES